MFQVTDDQTLQRALEFINENDLLAYDIETTGLNPRKDRIIGFGVSSASDGFYVPILTYKNGALETIQIGSKEKVLAILSALSSKLLIMFNASFDARFTKYQYGIDLVQNLHTDVLLLKHTCDEDFPFGLKDIAKKLWGTDVTKEKEEMQASIKANGGSVTEYYKADTSLIAAYCIKDCLLTFRVYNYYLPKLKSERLESFFYEDEVMPLYREVTIPMEEHGLALDMLKLNQALSDISADIARLESDIQAAIAPQLSVFETWFLNKDYPVQTRTGKQPAWARKGLTQKEAWIKDYPGEFMFNLQSKFHLKKLFFDTLKLKPLSKTPTGLPQVDEEFMNSIVETVPWVADLIKYNKLQKLKSTYIERFLNEQEDGIFYPSFFQHRTVSGRYGSDVQQMPRPMDGSDVVAKYTNMVREFIISRPNTKLMSADYEQLEPTIFAHTSNDNALQSIFKNGLDFYSEVAIRTERLLEVSSTKSAPNYLGAVNKKARQKAKSYALGIAYGLTGYKLQFELGIPVEQAEQLVQDYLNAFPDLRRFINETHDKVIYNGHIRTQSGRVRRLSQAIHIFKKYGARIRDSLQLYKDYHQTPSIYAEAKQDRKTYINLMNNAVNFQIQGLAASVVNRACIKINRRIRKEGWKANLSMQIHDQAVYEVADEHIEEFSKIMKHEMETVMKLSTPLKAEPIAGDCFAKCK